MGLLLTLFRTKILCLSYALPSRLVVLELRCRTDLSRPLVHLAYLRVCRGLDIRDLQFPELLALRACLVHLFLQFFRLLLLVGTQHILRILRPRLFLLSLVVSQRILRILPLLGCVFHL